MKVNKYIKIILITVITVSFFFLLIPFLFDISGYFFCKNLDKVGQYGDFIGGVLGTFLIFISIVLLYLTLKTQRETLKGQELNFHESCFDQTFFNLLKAHQDITASIHSYFFQIENYDNVITFKGSGREFFAYSVYDINKIFVSLNQNVFLEKFDSGYNNFQYISHQIEEIQKENIIDEDKKQKLEQVNENNNLKKINLTYNITNNIFQSFKKLDSSKEKQIFIYKLFYQKHKFAVGHYFSNLKQLLSYIDKYNLLINEINESNKNESIANKINNKQNTLSSFVEAQLSTFEITLLYYHSLIDSDLLYLVNKYNLMQNLNNDDISLNN
ncbi:MAG TPA: hypothetical protein DEH02_22055 [Bacteroidales bacterium]|nr:MAG: hypothetical protein A2X01_00085 [Bacteroidetes bacterium GWF2_35_48]HBX53747.1 hypothetical protein [Bacteroidales bacterium]